MSLLGRLVGRLVVQEIERLAAEVHEVRLGLHRIEGRLRKMPTRTEFDELKRQLKEQIAAETQQVTKKIQELKDQLAQGEPITQQDLDDLREDIAGVSGVLPDEPPTP